MPVGPASFGRRAAEIAGRRGRIGGPSRIGDALVGQLAHPRGAIGRMLARAMNRANADLTAGCVGAIDVGPGARVADVGFGGGAGLEALLDTVGLTGIVTGVEPSATMRARAERRLRQERAMDRLRILDGTAARTGLDDESQDGVITVNTVYFWPDVAEGLAELLRILRPGAALAVGISSVSEQRAARFASRAQRMVAAQELAAMLADAGFEQVAVASPRDDDGPAIVRGRRPAP